VYLHDLLCHADWLHRLSPLAVVHGYAGKYNKANSGKAKGGDKASINHQL
jgi:hypothetical protein